MARIDIRAVEPMAFLEESVTPGTTDVPKDFEDGANEGSSGGSKKRKYPNIDVPKDFEDGPNEGSSGGSKKRKSPLYFRLLSHGAKRTLVNIS